MVNGAPQEEKIAVTQILRIEVAVVFGIMSHNS